MKINGNIVSCAGNFALRARCKVARGTSHSVLVARLRGEAFEKPGINTLPIKGITHYTLTITH